MQERGYFEQPESSQEAIRDLSDLSSPISAFVRDECELDHVLEIECEKLYAGWTGWCESQGRDYPGTVQTFGRDLRAAVPGLQTTQRQRDKVRFWVYIGIKLNS